MQVHELAFETKLYIAWISTWFQVLYDHILMWWKISCWESCISFCQAQLQFQLCWAEIAFVSTFTSNIMNPNPNLNLTPTPTLVCMFMFTLPSFFSKFCFNEWYLKVRLMSSLHLSPTLIIPNPNLNLTPTPTLVCMFTFTSPFFFSISWTPTLI